MNLGGFKSSLNSIKSILFKLKFLKQINDQPLELSPEFKNVMFDNDYRLKYETAIDRRDYSFTVVDDSFFQFNFERSTGKLRYGYYPNPFKVKKYEDWLIEKSLDIQEAGTMFQFEYEQYCSESELKGDPLVVRYEVDRDGYREIHHPASHFHLGENNSIRIPVKHILSPSIFVFFIIKQIYLDDFLKLIKDEKFLRHYMASKESCRFVESDFFSSRDVKELFIS